MKTKAMANKMSSFTHLGSKLPCVGIALGVFLGMASTGSGCNVGAEGIRCNPYLVEPGGGATYGNSSDECGSGLACTTASYGPPSTGRFVNYPTWSPNAPCAENYCCPTHGMSTNPNCLPGCNGGAAYVCSLGETLPGDASLAYVCEVAGEIEAGTPISDGAVPPDAGEQDAEPDAEPDATEDAAPEEASDSSSVDAPTEGE